MRTIGLVGGMTPESTGVYYQLLIRRCRERLLALCSSHITDRAVDGVILGCTELPLVIAEGDLPVPLLDTSSVHVDAILDRALA